MELAFAAAAPGFMRKGNTLIRPDGEEHIITLAPALTVQGKVSDQFTGQPIPRFRVVLGYPDSQKNPRWSSLSRDWLDFSDGQYRHVLEQPLLLGQENPGYMFKFLAEGYAPFVSRRIGPDEGSVSLDVTLRRAVEIAVRVRNVDGSPAAGVEVGLVSASSHLKLGRNGFLREEVVSAGSLLRTEVDGVFKLPADDSILRVIAASADGYGETLPSALAANPILQLQPWGHLEIKCTSGGRPKRAADTW